MDSSVIPVPETTRRKACDLCFVKKIKCDMVLPTCSNCKQYKAQCRTTAIRRRPAPTRDASASDLHAAPPMAAPFQGLAMDLARFPDPSLSSSISSSQDGLGLSALPRPRQDTDRRMDTMESRLSNIEEQLKRVIDLTTAALGERRQHEQSPPQAPAGSDTSTGYSRNSIKNRGSHRSNLPMGVPIHSRKQTPSFSPSSGVSGNSRNSRNSGNSVTGDVGEDLFDSENDREKLYLPPLQEIQPIVEDFFQNYNNLIPVFDQTVFMRMLFDWYAFEAQRTRVKWAAIYAVLAMGYSYGVSTQHSKEDGGAAAAAAATAGKGRQQSLGLGHNKYVRTCFDKANSALPDLAVHEESLLGLQAIVILALLAHGSRDGGHPVMIVGVAMRLAHRLMLHAKPEDALHDFPAREIQQRARLFWVVYMLDKDISMRRQTPSVQQDADIELDMPPLRSGDGVGEILLLAGRQHAAGGAFGPVSLPPLRFAYFRSRVRLAHIEGQIFDQMYSSRSMKITNEERRRRVARLENMLRDWLRDVPAELRMENVAETLSVSGAGAPNRGGRDNGNGDSSNKSSKSRSSSSNLSPLLQMAFLHSTYVQCLVMVHGVWSHNADWIQRISSYSRAMLQECSIELPVNSRVYSQQQPPSLRNWEQCVSDSRACVRLLTCGPQMEGLIWQNCCSFISAVVVLLANIFIYPEAPSVPADRTLTSEMMHVCTRVALGLKHRGFSRVQAVALELAEAANRAADLAAEKRATATAMMARPPMPVGDASWASPPEPSLELSLSPSSSLMPPVSAVAVAAAAAATTENEGLLASGSEQGAGTEPDFGPFSYPTFSSSSHSGSGSLEESPSLRATTTAIAVTVGGVGAGVGAGGAGGTAGDDEMGYPYAWQAMFPASDAMVNLTTQEEDDAMQTFIFDDQNLYESQMVGVYEQWAAANVPSGSA